MNRLFLFFNFLMISILVSLQAAVPLKTLEITADTPREMFVKDPVTREQKPYWVVTYRLENKTGEDRELALRAFLESDVKRLDQEFKRTHVTLNYSIENRIEDLDKRNYLNYIEMSEHPFRRGEVRDGIFIFPRPPRRADELVLYIDGLSGVQIKEESSERLRKMRADYVSLVRPVKNYYNDREEERYRPMTDNDIARADGTVFQERFIYRQRFVREGDEFHVHEDDIKHLKNELDRWMLVIDPLKN